MARSDSADSTEDGELASTLPVADEMKYETALAELEKIVQNMEAGLLPLEESIAAYQRGCALLTHCQRQLMAAESKIQVLENGILRDLDSASGESR